MVEAIKRANTFLKHRNPFLVVQSFFFLKRCDPEKQDIDTAIIEYVANTRGFIKR
jgi:hypothetical protein